MPSPKIPGSMPEPMLSAPASLRDLSAHVADISPATLHPDTLARLAAINPATLPLLPSASIARGLQPVCRPGDVGEWLKPVPC